MRRKVPPKRDSSVRWEVHFSFPSGQLCLFFHGFFAYIQVPAFQIVAAKAIVKASNGVGKVPCPFAIGSYFQVDSWRTRD